MYLISQGILKRASFLEAHIIGRSGDIESGAKSLLLQHRQQVNHLRRVTPYNGKNTSQ